MRTAEYFSVIKVNNNYNKSIKSVSELCNFSSSSSSRMFRSNDGIINCRRRIIRYRVLSNKAETIIWRLANLRRVTHYLRFSSSGRIHCCYVKRVVN